MFVWFQLLFMDRSKVVLHRFTLLGMASVQRLSNKTDQIVIAFRDSSVRPVHVRWLGGSACKCYFIELTAVVLFCPAAATFQRSRRARAILHASQHFRARHHLHQRL